MKAGWYERNGPREGRVRIHASGAARIVEV